MIPGQLDLFAGHDPVSDNEVWSERFGRAPWVAPWNCSGGLRKGQGVLGWVCPSCGVLEVNGFVLNVNHGYDPQIPGRQPYMGWGAPCSRMILLASQA